TRPRNAAAPRWRVAAKKKRTFRPCGGWRGGLVKNEPTAKMGVKNKRLVAAWDDGHLEKVAFGH
ncbi:MAG: hypothetical protein ACRC7O_15635, partial [Fimbriiglobus sp.]